MSAVTNAPGKAMVVKLNGAVLKSSTFRRERRAGEIPLPTSGLSPDADSNYEVPFAAGMITTRIIITSIYDSAVPFHGATHSCRAGVEITAQFGMVASALTPANYFNVMSTTDSNDAEKTGLWECELMPASDNSSAYFS